MKALTFKRYGKSPEIGFADMPRPTPKPDELLVQVHAASVNPIEKATGILKPGGKIVSLVGPLDVAFARARGLNVVLTLVLSLMSRKIMTLAQRRNVGYSFLFARPDGNQLAQIGQLIEAQRIRPVIDRVFAFEQAKDALEYLAQGRSRGKVVVRVR